MASKYEEMMKAKGFLPYHLEKLPDKFIQIAKEELGETDEIRGPALEQFRKRILEDKKLKCPTNDEFLIQFLRARKYDVDKAMGLLRNYFNLLSSHPEIFDNLDKEKMDKLTCSDVFNILPFRNNDGCLLLTIKIKNWDSDDIDVEVLFCTAAAILFSLVNYPANQICGARVLYDVKNYSFKQMRTFIPKHLTFVIKALRNNLPIRFKSIHLINEGNVYHYAWQFLRLFVSEKIKSRIYMHGDTKEEIQKYIPKEVLPPEFGGDLINYNDDDWLTKEVEKIYDEFLKMMKTFYS
ncbi:alpha-tocopherol transfer protein-like [Trichonephila inaurata madagascariensis]|uniref:Alpha-tocopherol transfer protein-like n=1 Tax=Trichonephila inaurata madagascariensis TaxID=2747483 RepID=A0A8X6Y041_9ARAC|nr:alpha-tocopherol transfer protein-like [Trichonephila inaurata madagascariensis]